MTQTQDNSIDTLRHTLRELSFAWQIEKESFSSTYHESIFRSFCKSIQEKPSETKVKTDFGIIEFDLVRSSTGTQWKMVINIEPLWNMLGNPENIERDFNKPTLITAYTNSTCPDPKTIALGFINYFMTKNWRWDDRTQSIQVPYQENALDIQHYKR